MLIAAVAAYLLVNAQDEKFKSSAIISTGIMGAEGLNTEREIPFFQKFQIEMSVNNLTEFIQSRQNVNLLSYHLLLHDLRKSSDNPFRIMKVDEENPINYSEEEINALLDLMEIKVDSLQAYLDDELMEPIYKDLAKAFEYDYESLLENLEIGRTSTDSDLLKIGFESEKAKLCAYVVNTYCDVVLSNHRALRRKEDKDKVEFYKTLVVNKKQELDNKERQFNNYKLTGDLVDIGGQKESAITQIKELELQLEENIQKRDGAIRDIQGLDEYLNQYDGKGQDDAMKILSTGSIVALRERIKALNNAYIESNFKDEKVRIQKESTERQLNDQLKLHANSRKKTDIDSDASGENILIKKIEAESERNLSEGAITSIRNELNRLRGRSSNLTSKDIIVNKMERDIDVINNEYRNLKSQLNLASINLQNVRDQLNLLEHAQVPDEPEPANKAIISAFAGIIAGTLATLIIFLLSYFDTSFSSPQQFEKFTDLDLLGKMNKVKTNDLDLNNLYNSNGKVKSLEFFRESMRGIRYLIESSGSSIFLFTSTKADEGKTFTILNIAQSLKIKNKKVLLIDTNFKKNTLTQLSSDRDEPNLELQKLIVEHQLADVFGQKELTGLFNINDLDVIANSGNFLSPSEIFAGKDFHTFLDKLTLHYDYIFFEAPAMNKYSDAKELTDYAEKVVTVFSADSDLKPEDHDSLEFIKGIGNKFMGAVLNKVDLKNLN